MDLGPKILGCGKKKFSVWSKRKVLTRLKRSLALMPVEASLPLVVDKNTNVPIEIVSVSAFLVIE